MLESLKPTNTGKKLHCMRLERGALEARARDVLQSSVIGCQRAGRGQGPGARGQVTLVFESLLSQRVVVLYPRRRDGEFIRRFCATRELARQRRKIERVVGETETE